MVDVVQYGFGNVGRCAFEIMLGRKDLNVVGVVDILARLLGKDPGEVIGIGKTGLKIKKAESILKECKANVITYSCVTPVDSVYKQIRPFIEAGSNVITTSEEMYYPWATHPKLARVIDRLARKHEVAVVGTGLNPGFYTSLLPLVLCGACRRVDSIEIRRVVDYSDYLLRPPYKGFGMSPDKFADAVKGGIWTLGRGPFPGRAESIYMLAESLGWKLDCVKVRYKPIISKRRRKTPWGFYLRPGTVSGSVQIGTGLIGKSEKVRIECFVLCHPNAEEDGVDMSNTILVKGDPSYKLSLEGGGFEHRTSYVTAVRLVNIIPEVMKAEPGLHTERDLFISLPFS